MPKETVEYIEIWKTEGEYPFKVCTELLVCLSNGVPLYLKDGLGMERSRRNKEEVDLYFKQNRNK